VAAAVQETIVFIEKKMVKFGKNNEKMDNAGIA
jgi:hypothetical protein